MQRRDLITLLACATATWSVAARAQQAGKIWRIGSLSPGSSGQSDNIKIFMRGLNDLGYVDGRNTQFERRVADGNLDRLPALAADLVRADVDVICNAMLWRSPTPPAAPPVSALPALCGSMGAARLGVDDVSQADEAGSAHAART
jgi:hypothetical protein